MNINQVNSINRREFAESGQRRRRRENIFAWILVVAALIMAVIAIREKTAWIRETERESTHLKAGMGK